MPISITLPKWYDLHTHFRQGENVKHYIADHLAMGCAGALAMPNTKPPVSAITGPKSDSAWTIKAYREDLISAGGDLFDHLITPLYLTRETTPAMIAEGAASGLLQAAKYYPPHGTTNSEHGVPIEEWIGSDVLRAMEDNEVILCIHGEQHGLEGPEYFDSNQTAESFFYFNRLPRLLEAHPKLKIVCEHITTEAAASFVSQAPSHVGATITPQHLLYTMGHLVQGLKYHLYCLPLVKFQRDRAALRSAVTEPGQDKFFAGTDSAPHTSKMTECGCAAGCYTGGCAPQLYAMAFEEAGAQLETAGGIAAFTRFLSTNGPAFYGFAPSKETFTLTKEPSTTTVFETKEGPVTPLPSGLGMEMSWSLKS
ncbi:MAG: hypothetical protein P1U68_06920 [Verrucomicrobiales bacterium]|nr:hypothetical protein [Verrucomicrobiales bacterium]